MLKNVLQTLTKLDHFEENADPDLKAFLMEVRWHLENLHLSQCVQDAIFHLGDHGYYNPSEELLEKTTQALFYNQEMQQYQYELTAKIVEDFLSETQMQLSYFVVPGEVITDYTLDSGETFQCVMEKWQTDLEGAIKTTKDMLLKHGTPEDVKRIMGAYIPEEGELKELEASGRYKYIGGGYILPGYLVSMTKRIPGEEEA